MKDAVNSITILSPIVSFKIDFDNPNSSMEERVLAYIKAIDSVLIQKLTGNYTKLTKGELNE